MFKTRKLYSLVAVVLMLALVVTGCGSAKTEKPAEPQKQGTQTPEKLKVAFVYIGPVGDAGWTTAHDIGRKYLAEQMPNVETTIQESIPEGPESERVFEELAQKGNKIIFATSFGYMPYVTKVAKKYPDVVFMHCSGSTIDKNLGTYFGRMYQARYLSGIVAGKQTKSNNIGYVAAFPIPEVVRGINAFTRGVTSVNPKAKVKVIWTNTWYDPAKEKDAAKTLLDAGADVIAQHQDTPGPQQAAEEKGAFGVGYDSDMSKFAPKAELTSPMWNWGPYYVSVVKSVIDKTWKSEQYWGPMSSGIVQLAPYGSMVTEDTKKLVAEKEKLIAGGTWDVFSGPIKDQNGVEKVKAGAKMSDREMLEFNWFVEGVEGTIPQSK